MTDSPPSESPIEDSEEYREVVVAEGVSRQRIDLYLTHILDGTSRMQVRMMVHEGGATVDGRTVRPSFKIAPGHRIRFRTPEPPEDGPVPEPIPLDVLYEDDGMIVINKPAGMVVHPARGHWSGTLTSALAYHFQSLSDVGGPTRPGIVHRLDRDTSGVIVVAKTNAVHLNLSEQFAGRTVQKQYIALTAGVIDRDRDTIDQPIGRHPYQRDKMAIRAHHATSRDASTFYEVIKRYRGYTYVRVFPKTGRTHQIRVHLNHIGTPVLCDKLYSGRNELSAGELGLPSSDPDAQSVLLNRQALHAHQLSLDHPQSGKRMEFSAPVPADMSVTIEHLEKRCTPGRS